MLRNAEKFKEMQRNTEKRKDNAETCRGMQRNTNK